jgi:hypothetical protein
MNTNPGFYRFNGEQLSYAASSVYAPNYTLLAEDHEGIEFPIDGWFWFNSLSEAEAYFGINGATNVKWLEFGAALAVDPAINQFVATIAQAAPVLHLMIGVGLGQAAQGDVRTFLEAWKMGLSSNIISADLQQHLIAIASGYDLPQKFIDGLSAPDSANASASGRPENPQRFDRWTDSDGNEWVYDQPRTANGTYAQDNPETEVIESALKWVPATQNLLLPSVES